MLLRSFACVMAMAVASPTPASAQETTEAEVQADPDAESERAPADDPAALQREGMLRFLASDYEGALDHWQRAYALTQDAELLLDIAQALESLGRYQEALDTSREA